MKIITESDFRKSLKGDISGGFFFYGSEDYLKLHALKCAREAVCPDPSLEFFNNVRIDGTGFEPSALAAALPTLPVMADKKLIEVTRLNINAMKKNEIDELCAVLAEAADYDFNVIIISVIAGGVDEGYSLKKPSKILNTIGEHVTPVYFPQSTPAMLNKWVARHFAHNGIEADPAFCAELVEYCGKDMFVLSGETDKLSWYLHAAGRTRAEKRDIPNICVPNTGYDTFAFANAISARRRADALNILSEMQRRRIEPTMVLGEITATFCNMLTVRLLADDGLSLSDISKISGIHEFRVGLMLDAGVGADRLRSLLELCADADSAIKNSYTSGYMPRERLICNI